MLGKPYEYNNKVCRFLCIDTSFFGFKIRKLFSRRNSHSFLPVSRTEITLKRLRHRVRDTDSSGGGYVCKRRRNKLMFYSEAGWDCLGFKLAVNVLNSITKRCSVVGSNVLHGEADDLLVETVSIVFSGFFKHVPPYTRFSSSWFFDKFRIIWKIFRDL